MNWIIVGVDGSNTSLEAARKAALLSQALDCELLVLCAYTRDVRESVEIGTDTWVISAEEEATSASQSVVHTLQREFPTVKSAAETVFGKPHEALVDAATTRHSRLLVVGNVGMRGLGRLLGS